LLRHGRADPVHRRKPGLIAASAPESHDVSLRVAIVGSGPAGLFTAQALLRNDGITVDVFERLDHPFGLLRYGVAPDHPSIRSIASALQAVLDDPAVRLFTGVEVGSTLTV